MENVTWASETGKLLKSEVVECFRIELAWVVAIGVEIINTNAVEVTSQGADNSTANKQLTEA